MAPIQTPMRDSIISSIMSSIVRQGCDPEQEPEMITVSWPSVSTIAEQAADEILRMLADLQERQWEAEYDTAHL